MSKHTPGPWEFIQTNDDGGGTLDPDSGHFPENGEAELSHRRNEWLALSHDGEFNDDDRVITLNAYPSIANARLIAAAPELLELLKEIRHSQWAELSGTLEEKIDSLIAKATGGAK